ncbi:MAG: c-type cytochrome domain-containing protein [Pirellulaceae bacterium]
MLTRFPTVVWLVCLVVLYGSVVCAQEQSEELDFFENKVRPLLVESCYECHAGEERSGGLLLDSRDGWMAGGDSGPGLIPGDLENSLLIEAVRYGNHNLQMPPDGRLSDADIAVFEQWVLRGTHYAFILTSMNFTAIVMLGMHAGQWLSSAHSSRRKLLGLIGAGLVSLSLGWLWSFWFPIIKPIFTSSMVLWASGWCLLLLALFYLLVDMLRWRAWAFPFIVIGSNAVCLHGVTRVWHSDQRHVRVLFSGVARHLQPFGLASSSGALAMY